MKIDKSKFNPGELKQYEALIAKALVPDDSEKPHEPPSQPPEPEPVPPVKPENPPAPQHVDTDQAAGRVEQPAPAPNVQKNVKAPDDDSVAKAALELKAMRERVEKLEKQYEISQLTHVVKKYAVLGEKENELAETLYALKKSDAAVYNAYVSMLDKQLELVNKSGLFTEIGKSGHGSGASTLERIETAASEIQKADPSLNRTAAIAKAWENHPELVEEYDAEYNAG